MKESTKYVLVSWFLLSDILLMEARENATTVSFYVEGDSNTKIHIFIKELSTLQDGKIKIVGFSRDYYVKGTFSIKDQKGDFCFSILKTS